MAGTDCVDCSPTFPGTDLILVDFPAAPRSQDHFRIRSHNRIRRNGPALCVALAPKMRKNAFATGKLDQFVHPPDAADEWVHPLLEEDPWAARESAGGFRDLRKLAPKPFDERESAGLSGDKPRQGKDGFQHLLHGSLVEDQHVDSGFDQIVRDLRLELREADHKIRP